MKEIERKEEYWGEWMDDDRTFWEINPAPCSASLRIATIYSGLNRYRAIVKFLSDSETNSRIGLHQLGTVSGTGPRKLDSPSASHLFCAP